MKLSILCLLPIASMAFAPGNLPSRVAPMRTSTLVTNSEIDEACEKVTSTTEEYVGKADSLILNRAMRFVDHAPMIVTLKALTAKAGISASMWSVTSNPGAFAGLGTALAVPTWCYNIWTLMAVTQVASILKSSLASEGNELSQADITSSAVANFAAMRMIDSATPLRDTALAALISGYALRQGDSDGAVTVHKAAMQLMSSFTTVLTVLGVASTVCSKIPLLASSSELIAWVGIASYYVLATRAANGTVKKAVNAGVVGGMLWSTLAGGVSITANVGSLFTNIGIAGMAYVAYRSIDSARQAVFA
jgi:hypothetical protein